MTGVNNPFYGHYHSDLTKHNMMLSKTNRKHIYQYLPDYTYTGVEYMSLNKAKDANLHLASIQRILNSGGTSQGFRYSIVAPVLNTSTGLFEMPVSARVQDPFGGTGSAKLTPIMVTHKGSDIIQCFVALRRAITVIKKGSIWPNVSVSRPSVVNAQSKVTKGAAVSVKGFTVTPITRAEFMEWYNGVATREQQVLSYTP